MRRFGQYLSVINHLLGDLLLAINSHRVHYPLDSRASDRRKAYINIYLVLTDRP